jgi:hypothetical protein
MKLFHFTCAANVLPIMEQGLLPHLDPAMSPDCAVVWLTEQPDVRLSQAEGDAVARTLKFLEAPYYDLIRMKAGEIDAVEAGPPHQWWYGSKGERMKLESGDTITFVPPVDDLMRLTVQVPDDGDLHRYATWPHRPMTPFLRKLYKLPYVRLWRVYTGRLAASSIVEANAVRG